MRGFVLAAAACCFGLLALLGIVAAAAIGAHLVSPPASCVDCVNCPGCPGCPNCPAVSPFAGGGGFTPFPSQPSCPDGICPLPNGSVGPNGSIEFGDPREGGINANALEEPKGDIDDADRQAGCPTCPQLRRPMVRPVMLVSTPASRPTVATKAQTPVPLDAPREGAFQCQRCKKPTVGEQWQELWADDGTPMTCLCRNCWHAMKPEQRESQLRSYVAKSKLSPSSAFYVNAAIKEFASR